MITDMRVACGNMQLAQLAGQNFHSPVYHFINEQRPNRPYSFGEPWESRYSFHTLDLFEFLDDMSELSPTYPLLPSDVAYRQLLQQHFLSLAATGAPGSDWLPVQSAHRTSMPAAAASPAAMSADSWIQTALLTTNLTMTTSARLNECAFWQTNGFISAYSWNN